MRPTIGHTTLATPYLAVPPPATRGAANVARPATNPLRRLYHRHVATLGAIATIAVAVLALDWLTTPAGPDGLPLWLVLVAGIGTVAVGTSVRRLERRWRSGAPRARPASSEPPRRRATDALRGAPQDGEADADATSGWRHALGVTIAAASVGSLMLALALPGDARSSMLAIGLVGVLALRLVVAPRRGAAPTLVHDAGSAAARPTPAIVTAAGPTARRTIVDGTDGVLLDSFPASDPPSWSSLRAGPPQPPRDPVPSAARGAP